MSGIDRQRVVGRSDEDLDELICGICHQIFVKPVVLQCCGQIYCSECILQWFRQSDSCPNCRKILTTDHLVRPPRLVFNLLAKFLVKCEFHSTGCQVVLTLDKIKRHDEECDENPKNWCKLCKSRIIKMNYLKKENMILKNGLERCRQLANSILLTKVI